MSDGQETLLSQEQMNVAIKSPEHIKEWLIKSGRQWIVFNGSDLVEALPFPHGHDALMQVIMAYRDHRAGIPSGEVEMIDGKEVPLMKGERLELPEIDRCIRSLITEAYSIDPKWSLENPPL
jgi:hypothetical protein